MNQLIATITKIESVDNLNIVTFDFYGKVLKMMSLDLASDIEVAKKVQLTIKPTHLMLAKEFSGMLSLSNVLPAKVLSCENGCLLSSVKVAVEDATLESIMIVESSQKMDIKEGDEVSIMIAESELSIVRVL